MSEGLWHQLLDGVPKALVAALIPAAQVLWKWLKNRDIQSRKGALRTRIAYLAGQKESLAKLQQLPECDRLVSDVDAELKASIAELANLGSIKTFQKPAERSKVARWLLLFPPSGLLAWVFHTLFFLGLAIVALGFMGLLMDWDSEGPYGLLGLAVFMIPALIFRAIALKIANARSARQQVRVAT